MGRELVYKGRVIDVYRDKTVLPNGNEVELDYVDHPGAAAVVPSLGSKIIMLRQYRHAVGGYLYEIPAGKLDKKGEDSMECARRELKEETGYSSDKLKKIISIKTTPGFCNESIDIFLATGLTKGEAEHEADEVMEIVIFTVDEVLEMIRRGDIQDAKTLVGLYAFLRDYNL